MWKRRNLKRRLLELDIVTEFALFHDDRNKQKGRAPQIFVTDINAFLDRKVKK